MEWARAVAGGFPIQALGREKEIFDEGRWNAVGPPSE
jgi:hypothetical protein